MLFYTHIASVSWSYDVKRGITGVLRSTSGSLLVTSEFPFFSLVLSVGVLRCKFALNDDLQCDSIVIFIYWL